MKGGDKMSYFELASKMSRGGRRNIKMSLLEIYSDKTQTNKNGIHWEEKYVMNNIDSIKEIPICCEFLDDDKRVPNDHGFTGIDSTENKPLFENSEVVGCITNAYPEVIEINGEQKKILCGEGYIYEQRYPNFVKWLSENMANGNVMSSIEIMGTPENNNVIIYENNVCDSELRTPEVFCYSGTAILSKSVNPADDSAMVLQMNSLREGIKDIKNNESEENVMDEKMISQFVDSIKTTIMETNSKNEEYEAKITSLNEKVSEQTKIVEETNAKVVSETERADKAEAQVAELNKKIADLEAELAACKKEQKKSECNSALSVFTEEQKNFAKEKIEAFEADPMSVEINSIVADIYAGIGKKAIEDAKIKTSEINSAKETDDIYGEVNIVDKSDNEMSIY